MMATYWRHVFIALSLLAAMSYYVFSGTRTPPPKPEPVKISSLPALGADISNTTVSGISSGAYMAGQFQLSHASIVTGAAIIAGGPYGCAQSVFSGAVPGAGAVILSASRAINGCMLNSLTLWGVPNPARLAKKARALALENSIDPISDVVTDRVYLFSGTKDQTVKPPIVKAARVFYRALGVPDGNILYKHDVDAGHGFVTEHNGGSCSTSSRPYIVDCDYDQAGAVLGHLYGNLNPPVEKPGGTYIAFDQSDLGQTSRTHGLAKTGMAYVPPDCASRPGCRIHIAFHGCNQNRAAVGGAFIRQTGFARWADKNRIIVLFPQVSTGALNPTGCWDWWGYTGRDYLTRTAPQITIVRAMVDKLGATPPPTPPAGT